MKIFNRFILIRSTLENDKSLVSYLKKNLIRLETSCVEIYSRRNNVKNIRRCIAR
ncbi:MAG: hypothetical protein JJV93_03150 [Alphaproteobacteria bacterium]|nr:hypothetical protein [Alphaproteobacteria bacterium]MBL0718225.1 hypothetical protein [Alphaproteobacteria bacterium]